ncbi:ribosome assembly factor SBDS [archaeon]|jgi:ribosome maturation protein SDO1|nr:ribosome assembly factor SBDS [archaeon]MBT4397813.1 ribosome assembly factor SBDS [archaeon]MBT4441147.1 ribosome assembly factor SBDS [archaeon]
MVNVDKAIIARIKKEGEIFEILVDCDKALEYRDGKIESLNEVLATRDIFKDVKKAEKASETDMQKLFHSTNPDEVADIILKKGEIQLTAEYRNNLREERKKQIIAFIHRNAIDARTGLPHPPQRIEDAIEQSKCKIDEFRSVDEQVQEIVSKLRELLAIKFEVRELEITIPSQFTGPAYGKVKGFGKMLKEEWLSNGDLKIMLELPAGMQESLENELNKLTRGDVDIKILNKK